MASLWRFCGGITLSSLFVLTTWAAGPHFKKESIEVGSKKVSVEMAETPDQHEYGLMNRQSLKPDEGMLFIFGDERVLAFWMKNTFVDLSIGFFDSNKILVDVQEMKAVTSVMEKNIPTYRSAKPAQYALEMPKGWFAKNKIKVGDKLKLLSRRQ